MDDNERPGGPGLGWAEFQRGIDRWSRRREAQRPVQAQRPLHQEHRERATAREEVTVVRAVNPLLLFGDDEPTVVRDMDALAVTRSRAA